jgi:hypothetical protein
MLRLEVELTNVDAVGDLVYVEGRAADGTQLALYALPATLRGSTVAPGTRMIVTLELPAAGASAPPALRERMNRAGAPAGAAAAPRAASTQAAGGSPRAATQATGGPPRAATSAPPTNAGGGARNTTDAILSLLGKSDAGSGLGERDVDDEMDALLGRKSRG